LKPHKWVSNRETYFSTFLLNYIRSDSEATQPAEWLNRIA
jgi:hypothetical protein